MADQKDEQTPLEAEILREVAEELQEEQIKKMWKKISPYLTGLVVSALLVTGGWELYENYDARRSLEESEQLKSALVLIDSEDAGKGAEMLKRLSETSNRGYRYLAAFHYVAYLAAPERKQYEEAVHVLDRVINDGNAPQPIKNMAFFDKISLQSENGSLDSEQIQEELDKLIKEKGAWSALALNLSAEMALRRNDFEKAVEYWKEIMDDRFASEALRSRIDEYISFAENNTETGK